MQTNTQPEPAQLSPDDVRTVADALFYAPWQSELARAMGASRQTIASHLRHGCSGAHAAALLGLLARRIVENDANDAAEVAALQASHAQARSEKTALLARLEQKVAGE